MPTVNFLWAIATGVALTLQPTMACAQQTLDAKETNNKQEKLLPRKQLAQTFYNAYILGPGDSVRIEVLDLPELSGIFSIGPDGTMYLPRLRALYAEGLTVDELRVFITERFRQFVLQPEVFIAPVSYRSVRVYVGGEVARPGYYTINGPHLFQDMPLDMQSQHKEVINSGAIGDRHISLNNEMALQRQSEPLQGQQRVRMTAPTLFDALQAARGVTPFSQLGRVQVTRKRPQSQGGGKVRAEVNFLRMISNGDEEVNIRLYDGDTIFVHKSNDVLKEQLLAASRTNLSPDFLEVFVSGRVKEPGPQQLPQGASLNQAVASAGGPKLLRGKVEFLRFNREGSTDRRVFTYNPKAASGDYKNPVLMSGDVVRVNESIASASVKVLNEITAPVVGLYSVYSIYQDFQ